MVQLIFYQNHPNLPLVFLGAMVLSTGLLLYRKWRQNGRLYLDEGGQEQTSTRRSLKTGDSTNSVALEESPLPTDLLVALAAHNNMKPVMMRFVRNNLDFFKRVKLVTTGSTGSALKTLGLAVEYHVASGPLGGDQEIGALVSQGKVAAVFFFSDPLSTHPHASDIAALNRICCVHDIMFANNPSTANALLFALQHSSLCISRLLGVNPEQHIDSPIVKSFKENQQNVISAVIMQKEREVSIASGGQKQQEKKTREHSSNGVFPTSCKLSKVGKLPQAFTVSKGVMRAFAAIHSSSMLSEGGTETEESSIHKHVPLLDPDDTEVTHEDLSTTSAAFSVEESKEATEAPNIDGVVVVAGEKSSPLVTNRRSRRRPPIDSIGDAAGGMSPLHRRETRKSKVGSNNDNKTVRFFPRFRPKRFLQGQASCCPNDKL